MNPTVKFVCTSHLNLPPPLGNNQGKAGVFTSFSLDLGSPVFRECTTEREFSEDFTRGEINK